MDIGLIQKYFKDEMDKVAIIANAKKTAKPVKPLSLYHLEGPFIIYCILNGISIFIFICEYLYGRQKLSLEQEMIATDIEIPISPKIIRVVESRPRPINYNSHRFRVSQLARN